MAKFTISNTDFDRVRDGEKTVRILKTQKFESFDESVLGLGKIENKSKATGALCAIFDLEGFTSFCSQNDPQLTIPEYLSEFLQWLFLQIRNVCTVKKYPTGYNLYVQPPFFSKFLGDGVLFIWETENIDETQIINVVAIMMVICREYRSKFLKQIESKISTPPSRLRCGIAKGNIYSVGDGNDFVGPCINMASRLQKISSFSFCFSRKGLNPETNTGLSSEINTVKSEINGIGSNELICVLKREYDALSKEEKKKIPRVGI